MIKFPTEYGVGELRGDQIATHKCYIAMLEMDDHLQTMSIEEQRTGAKPVKRLKEIPSIAIGRIGPPGSVLSPAPQFAQHS